MTTSSLMRYARPLVPAQLADVLAGRSDPEVEATRYTFSLDDFKNELASARASIPPHSTPRQRAFMDARLAPHLHSALKQLVRRDAADMRIWHWLCTSPLKEFVLLRWRGDEPPQPSAALTPGLVAHFLGSATLNGVSRNAAARLWWCAEAMQDADSGYALTRQALANQDLFVAVFERKFGIYPPAARAAVSELAGKTGKEIQAAARRLNHFLTTQAAEVLDQAAISSLLRT